jgi:hypothetical protein
MQHPFVTAVESPLDRVIGIGEIVEAAGVSVELIAMEIRGAGTVLFWRAKPLGDLLLEFADIRVTDDRGTSYASVEASHEGTLGRWSAMSVLTPSPSVGTRLLVEVSSFGPPIDHEVPRGMSTQHRHGPWTFTVQA